MIEYYKLIIGYCFTIIWLFGYIGVKSCFSPGRNLFTGDKNDLNSISRCRWFFGALALFVIPLVHLFLFPAVIDLPQYMSGSIVEKEWTVAYVYPGNRTIDVYDEDFSDKKEFIIPKGYRLMTGDTVVMKQLGFCDIGIPVSINDELVSVENETSRIPAFVVMGLLPFVLFPDYLEKKRNKEYYLYPKMVGIARTVLVTFYLGLLLVMILSSFGLFNQILRTLWMSGTLGGIIIFYIFVYSKQMRIRVDNRGLLFICDHNSYFQEQMSKVDSIELLEDGILFSANKNSYKLKKNGSNRIALYKEVSMLVTKEI